MGGLSSLLFDKPSFDSGPQFSMGKGLKELQAASDGDDFGGLQIEDDFSRSKPFNSGLMSSSSEVEDLKKKLAAAESNVSFFCEQMEQMKKENDELRVKIEAKPISAEPNFSKKEEVKEKPIMKQPSKVESDEDDFEVVKEKPQNDKRKRGGNRDRDTKVDKLAADLEAAKDDKMMMEVTLVSVKSQASETIG